MMVRYLITEVVIKLFEKDILGVQGRRIYELKHTKI